MSRGLLDHLEQAAHISAGMGISFAEAQEIVANCAQEIEDALGHRPTILHFVAEPTPPTTIGNVVYGVDFANKRPKVVTHGTL